MKLSMYVVYYDFISEFRGSISSQNCQYALLCDIGRSCLAELPMYCALYGHVNLLKNINFKLIYGYMSDFNGFIFQIIHFATINT